MAMLNARYIAELQEYLKSGDLAEDFKWSVEERRGEILEFLEMLMDLGELADEAQANIPAGTVTIFGNDEIRFSMRGGAIRKLFKVIIFRTINEHYLVGILFNRT